MKNASSIWLKCRFASALSQIVTGGLEGALFGGCIVGAMMIAERHLVTPPRP